MDTIVLIFFFGQLWWNHLSAEIKVPANSSSPTYLYSTHKSGVLIQNERRKTTPAPPSSVKPWATEYQELPDHDGHLIAAVIIGVILMSMIIVIVGIFLWKRWRRTDTSVPHWAGRSPFADGDIADVTTNKEPVHGIKRSSVLSLLPWKFNKDTQLLESDEGQLSESRASLDALPSCGAEETVGQSSPIANNNSISSTSMQTSVCTSPSNLSDIQSAIPEPLDLPPPPNWLQGVNEDLCPISNESHLLEKNADAQCSVAPGLIHQNLGEESLLPPPPEDFI
ncbi:hypothetical protein lerEdw1_001811 [Lerista edwardsae]|nr:hypothetical protein lerEdw1_001811 [Lerista edwardsae]